MKKSISSGEIEISGKWFVENGTRIEDESCKRISALVAGYLEFVGRDASGWDALYKDPSDGRFWELLYLNSDQHGGGPPTLRQISISEAKQKYGEFH